VPSEPWDLAHRAATDASVELRPLRSLADCDAIIDVMIATWGDYQTVPREVIRALAESGNVPHGAFAEERLIGYVLGWAAVDPQEGLHVHSHQLAALPDRRHAGVGYALKLAQRAQALDQGITFARWTFDPLVARNAYFNIHKLGAVADRFERNFYGDMTDELNRGDRSDRLFVRWDLERSPSHRPYPPGDVIDVVWSVRDGDIVRPERRGDPVARSTGSVTVQVPDDVQWLKQHHPEIAAEWRDAVADALEECLSLGMRAVAFERGANGVEPHYHLATREATIDRPGWA
jgi:predicted GNAT superfamily acetyltransferase